MRESPGPLFLSLKGSKYTARAHILSSLRDRIPFSWKWKVSWCWHDGRTLALEAPEVLVAMVLQLSKFEFDWRLMKMLMKLQAMELRTRPSKVR